MVRFWCFGCHAEDEAGPPGGAASSDDDFAAQPSRGRRGLRAAAPAQQQQRPSRLAKTVAMTAFVDEAQAGSDGEETVSEQEEEEEEQAPARGGSRAAPRAGAARTRSAGGSGTACAKQRQSPAPKRQRVEADGQGQQMDVDGGAAGTAAPPRGGSRASQQQAAATTTEDGGSSGEEEEGLRPSSRPARPPRVRAISNNGHTCRGRVRQKSHKSADLVTAGTLRWAAAGSRQRQHGELMVGSDLAVLSWDGWDGPSCRQQGACAQAHAAGWTWKTGEGASTRTCS